MLDDRSLPQDGTIAQHLKSTGDYLRSQEEPGNPVWNKFIHDLIEDLWSAYANAAVWSEPDEYTYRYNAIPPYSMLSYAGDPGTQTEHITGALSEQEFGVIKQISEKIQPHRLCTSPKNVRHGALIDLCGAIKEMVPIYRISARRMGVHTKEGCYDVHCWMDRLYESVKAYRVHQITAALASETDRCHTVVPNETCCVSHSIEHRTKELECDISDIWNEMSPQRKPSTCEFIILLRCHGALYPMLLAPARFNCRSGSLTYAIRAIELTAAPTASHLAYLLDKLPWEDLILPLYEPETTGSWFEP